MVEQHSVQVGTQYYRESIYERLRQLQEQEKLPVVLHEYQQGKHWLIDCEFQLEAIEEDRETTKKIHSYYLANAIAETILQHWEKDHIRWLLKSKYKMKREEVVQIFEKALQYLNQESQQWKGYRIHRKASLVNQIVKCIEAQSLFDMEGFLRFRAKDYKEEIHKAVNYVVNEHVIETEYEEFINLLRRFVDSQKPRIHTLHVGITRQGKFNLYNEEGKKITKKYMDDLSFMDTSQELTYEDLLVSALIAVAPRKIVMHIRYEGYKDTLQTICKVFEGRVSYCTENCSICEKI
ncbi:YtxC-like family protein [Desulfitobacterium dehalogenans ATCC 51507]|uniref:YtxC-like family protein n=1 Tax=Desulfitobacterium dehalogenans (strain ATCC 51507 / DSM 9161 / JW/IU-DC1) TaxID=756499 RepID=I4A3W3_DESDJ|nr:YtxC-like family protein [Desulfitobacterium dehalogenans ATCC 51507]